MGYHKSTTCQKLRRDLERKESASEAMRREQLRARKTGSSLSVHCILLLGNHSLRACASLRTRQRPVLWGYG